MRHRLLPLWGAAALLASATALAAPPPWAPAHGYRYRNLDGVELVYDARHGVWEALAIAGLYYLEGRYWRQVHDHWEWSDRHDGAWRRPRGGAEPPALRDWRPASAAQPGGAPRRAGPGPGGQGPGAGKGHGPGGKAR